MNLHGQHSLELPALGVEVDDIDRRMPINPMSMMVPLDENPVVMPLIGLEFPERNLTYNPWLGAFFRLLDTL